MGLSMPLNVCAVYAPFKATLAWFLWMCLAIFAYREMADTFKE